MEYPKTPQSGLAPSLRKTWLPSTVTSRKSCAPSHTICSSQKVKVTVPPVGILISWVKLPVSVVACIPPNQAQKVPACGPVPEPLPQVVRSHNGVPKFVDASIQVPPPGPVSKPPSVISSTCACTLQTANEAKAREI